MVVPVAEDHECDIKQRSLRKERSRGMPRWRKLTYAVIFLTLFLLVIEGACSIAIVLKHALFDPPLAERYHTEYDADLGWVNQSNFSDENMYGPRISFHTNSQRFRNATDFDKDIPSGKLRVMVSGDSFALGYGVGDDETWCSQLGELQPQWEVVNLGQGGYGVDQTYLWYQKVRDNFDHDIHLFTFITPDFDRMRYRNFSGYGKPVLSLQNGELVPENVPVPKTAYAMSKLARNGIALQELCTFRAIRRLVGPTESYAPAELTVEETQTITAAIARELQAFHDRNGSMLVVVHLPMHAVAQDVAWNDFLSGAALRDGWNYLDLTGALDHLTSEQRRGLFLQSDDVDYPGAAGHYSAAGNKFIAQLLSTELFEIDDILRRANELHPGE